MTSILHCDLCNQAQKAEEDMFVFSLSKKGGLPFMNKGRSGDICMSCKNKLDNYIMQMKGGGK